MYNKKIASYTKLALTVFLMSVILIPLNNLHSGTTGDVSVTVSLPTMQCNMCVTNISEALDNVKGVKNYSVDLEGKKVTVTYDDAVTTQTKIENAISKAGYDANNKKANKKAYDKLDDCCKVN